ncbi:hypothetical protein G3A43_44395 [Paraburkholderia aspalathi]|uniref:hypothetical protein n=1 Tax=Paraburkholderia nemoris TaxID=2793076 RepID=UPI0019095133|nr:MULTISPECIES: hypothetical protein [Paraburkholderia]MBK3787189.1 hypothetical protein [Paraburkholderia aspalathi]
MDVPDGKHRSRANRMLDGIMAGIVEDRHGPMLASARRADEGIQRESQRAARSVVDSLAARA